MPRGRQTADVGLASLGLQALSHALLQFEFVEVRLQHLDRLGAVLVPAAFPLDGDGDAGRDVRLEQLKWSFRV
jgi:hypothetical protein